MRAEPTVDEIIEVLKRSAMPTLITEGRDDYEAFRRLETALADQGISFLPVNGRTRALEVFDRRAEYNREDVYFFVDKDAWLFTGIPNQYLNSIILTTDGYSIENDLFRDGDLETLLDLEELTQFKSELENTLDWFSFAMGVFIEFGSGPIASHPNRFLSEQGALHDEYCRSCGYTGPTMSLRSRMSAEYSRYLRGKTLIALLLRQTCRPRRYAKFGYNELLAIGVSRRGPLMSQTIASVRTLHQST